MSGLIDILKGERGIFGILLIIAVTVFVILGLATYEQWATYTQWIFTVFVAGKTATSVVGLFTTRPSLASADPAPTAVPAVPAVPAPSPIVTP